MKVLLPEFKNKEYKLDSYGIISDDAFENQQLIQEAIDSISKNGGGYLVFPASIIKTGPIVLKDGVCLNLPRNCYLMFIKDPKFYTVGVRNWEGRDCFRCNSPISALNATNIGIIGEGTIDGCGDDWRPLKDWKVTKKFFDKCLQKSSYYVETKESKIWYPSKTSYDGCILTEERMTLSEANSYYDFFRPVLISLIECDKVLLKGFISSNSPAWNIHPLFCNNVTIDQMQVKNPSWAQNGDGIDIESCTNVEIKNSTFEVGDDGICIKSGKNAKAREIKRPTSNVYIHDCLVYHAHGGIVIGSEMSRGVNNLICENCTFVGTDIGIRFKSALGRGGLVSDIKIKNINMIDILEEAIIFNMDYSLFKMPHEKSDDVEAVNKDDIPYFDGIDIENVHCTGSKIVIKVLGIDPKAINDYAIRNITIKDSYIEGSNNYSIRYAQNIRLINTTLNVNGVKTYYKNEDLSLA